MIVGSGARVSASLWLILPDRICRYQHEPRLWFCSVWIQRHKAVGKKNNNPPHANTSLSSVSQARALPEEKWWAANPLPGHPSVRFSWHELKPNRETNPTTTIQERKKTLPLLQPRLNLIPLGASAEKLESEKCKLAVNVSRERSKGH